MVGALEPGPQRGPHFNAIYKEDTHPSEISDFLPAEAERGGPAEMRKYKTER